MEDQNEWRCTLRYLADSHSLTWVMLQALALLNRPKYGDPQVAILSEDQVPFKWAQVELHGQEKVKLGLHDIANNAMWTCWRENLNSPGSFKGLSRQWGFGDEGDESNDNGSEGERYDEDGEFSDGVIP